MTHDEKRKARREVKRNLRTRIKEKTRKNKIRKLNSMGETKFLANQVEKSKIKMKKELKNKNAESIKFTSSSQFFKNFQVKFIFS